MVSGPVTSFADLKIIQYPTKEDSEVAAATSSLKDCLGCLTELPLKSPNADAKKPFTVYDMVNILATNPHTQELFDQEIAEAKKRDEDVSTSQNMLPAVYDYETSDMMKQALKIIARSCCHIHGPAGHSVQQGCVSFYKWNGTTFAVGPGKWLLMSLKAKWIAKNIPINQEVIEAGPVLILQVPSGGIGRVIYKSSYVLLAQGTHVFNAGAAKNEGTVKLMDEACWSHGHYHALRVGQGQLAKVWVERISDDRIRSIQPRFLVEGEHFIDSHLFKFDELVMDNETYIQHGTIHKLSIDKGAVVKVWQQGCPRLLGEGVHVIQASSFKYCGTEQLSQTECIEHGTITILRIPAGKIALAWNGIHPVFITSPGLHEFDSPDFQFVGFRDSSEPVIQLGSKTILMVQTGQVAVTYEQGKLNLLQHGQHLLEDSNHVFQRFLSTQQQSVRLKTHKSLQESKIAPKKGGILKTVGFTNELETCSFEESKRREQEQISTACSVKDANDLEKEKDDDLELVVSETKDLVRVGLRADVLYSIGDASKLIEKTDPDKLGDMIRDTSVSVLTSIIRSTALFQMTKWKSIQGADEPPRITFLDPLSKENDSSTNGATEKGFFHLLQEKFATELKDSLWNDYGVRLAEIQISSFKILDEELAKQIAKHALTTAQFENKVSLLEAKAKVFTAEEETASEVKRIAAVADRNAQKFRADAKNERDIEAAKARAQAMKISELAKAEIEAEAMLVRAKAEAEAMRIRTLAEAERAELLSRTTLGRQLALMDRYAEMVIESRRGMQAIGVDPRLHAKSPFGELSPAIVSAELRSLENMAPPRSSGNRSTPVSTALTTCVSSVTDTKNRGRGPSSFLDSGPDRRSRSATRRNQDDPSSATDNGEQGHQRGVRRSRSSTK